MKDTEKTIIEEMKRRKPELIKKQKRNGGCASIDLTTEHLAFCYNPMRASTRSNRKGDKFFVAGTINGCPISMNESEMINFIG